MEVSVTGRDVQEAKAALHRGDRYDWITINPVVEFSANDERPEGLHTPEGYPKHTRPTECFRITWSDGNENFSRVVSSVKELNEVLKPIMARQTLATKLVKRQKMNMILAEKGRMVKARFSAMKEAEKDLEKCRRAYEDELDK